MNVEWNVKPIPFPQRVVLFFHGLFVLPLSAFLLWINNLKLEEDPEEFFRHTIRAHWIPDARRRAIEEGMANRKLVSTVFYWQQDEVFPMLVVLAAIGHNRMYQLAADELKSSLYQEAQS